MTKILREEGQHPEESIDEGVASPIYCPLLNVVLSLIRFVCELEGDRDGQDESYNAANAGHYQKIIKV